MKESLGIIGGLGPLASSYLYEMITKKTKATKDQDHLNIILLSHAKIPDRTSYILDNTKESPLPYLLEDCKTLEKMGAKMIVIPCNTSCYFHETLQKSVNIPVNNMIKDTVEYLKGKKGLIAILATTGTIKSKLYQKELEKEGLEYILPNQELVMEIIYDYIKKGKPITKEKWDNLINQTKADTYILGCTELSVVKKDLKLNDKFIDPLEVETEKILNYFGKEMKGEK